MRFYADLHVHSKYSLACSRDADLEHMAWWAALKGVAVLGTGDFTHPAWADQLRALLVPAEPGLFRLRGDVEREVQRRLPPACRTPVRFLLSTEISTISKRGDRTRKVHHLLFAPDLDAVAEITRRLARVGNLASDGRPILGLDPRDLLEIALAGGPGCYLVPAHVWTPWFSALGSKSGFDSIEECYLDLAGHVFAAETGLSSDPAMNWRVSGLDRYHLVSNSDAHSPPMIGREATVFDTDLDYFRILDALRTGAGLDGTVEFFPEEGKYHLDGHRACGVRLEPERTRELDGRCPTCARPLTVGVMHRVEVLADRPEGHRPDRGRDFRCLISLPQVVGELLGVGPKSRTVTDGVAALVARLGPEFGILTDVPLDDVARCGPPLLPEALDRLRRGAVTREAGYDGVYGTIRLFAADELAAASGPMLFDVGVAQPAAPAAVPGPGSPAGPGTPAAAQVELPWAPAPEAAPAGAGPGSSPSQSPVLDGLDPDQRAAATAPDGPLLIVAGPGTGKTRTLTHLLAHRVRDRAVAPDRCLALTFTRRACAEMRDRLSTLVPEQADRMLVTTFHGLGLRLVRELHERLGLPRGVRVADEETRLAVLRDLLGTEAGLGRIASRIAEAKHGRPGGDAGELGDLPARYDAALRGLGLVDLDDLVTLPAVALEGDEDLVAGYRRRWTEVCVDEYQDVDATQYRLLRLLCPPDGNLRVIGDPDQAVYGFRGADVGFFLRFHEDFPAARRVQLSRSYRSTPTIVRGALQAIAPATLVPDRALEPVRHDLPDGPIVVHRTAGEQEEAAAIGEWIERLLGGSSFLALDTGRSDGIANLPLSFSDIAVLYRTDAQAQPVAEALARRGFPFQKRSHERLGDRPGVRAVLHELRGAAPALAGTLSVAARLGRAVRAALEAGSVAGAEIEAAAELLGPLAADCGGDLDRFLTELALGAEVDTWDPRADRISLLTLHAAKGLEFAVVFIAGCEDGLVPLRWSRRAAGPEAAEAEAEAEERRLFFVGMTRATARLVLTSADRRARPGRTVEAAPSPFLADIDPALVDRRTGPPDGSARPPRQAWQLKLL
jgi:DNA helicase-2/ATP-dependent DNA helicase PcrA